MPEFDLKNKFSKGSEILQQLFESKKGSLSGPFLRWRLWARWDDYVGEAIAKNSEPVGYQKGVLYIWVKSSPWLQQMNFVRDQVKDRINSKLQIKFVKEVRFTLDRKDVPQDLEERQDLLQTVEKMMPSSKR